MVAAVATLPAQPVEAVHVEPEVQQQAAKPKVVLLVNKWSQTEREYSRYNNDTALLHCAL